MKKISRARAVKVIVGSESWVITYSVHEADMQDPASPTEMTYKIYFLDKYR